MIPEPVAAALRAASRPVCAYVYDTGRLRERARTVRAALPAGARLLYAVKANGHPEVVSALCAATDGLEVASAGELVLALGAGPAHIAFGGPAKTDAELDAAVAAGATVNVESPLELRRLALVGAGRPVRVALRVNRRAGVTLPGTHRMTGVPTPFGIDEAQLGEVAALAATLPGIELVGPHLHAVSNNLDAAAHVEFVRDALAWARRSGLASGSVNVGGGFGVDYTGTRHFDLDVLRDGLRGLPDEPRLVFELGRYLAADAGWYAAEVLDLKAVQGRWFAVLRGGTHHFRLPAAWGYSHPFEVLPTDGWRYPFARPCVAGVPVDAVGELCTPRDVLTRGQPVDPLRVGDVLVFGNAGAYGWDISHHDFLRHPYPQMIVI